MTPKEKANDMISSLRLNRKMTITPLREDAKNLALWCVDEIIKSLGPIPPMVGDPEMDDNDMADWMYWDEVKEEIEKL